MIHYRQAVEDDFHLTYAIKKRASGLLIAQIWGWDESIQLDYHKNQFVPGNTHIIMHDDYEAGYISSNLIAGTVYIENILLDTAFQGKGIGTKVLTDTITNAVQQEQQIELQVLKINDRAKKWYERLHFEIFENTALHYKMRYNRPIPHAGNNS